MMGFVFFMFVAYLSSVSSIRFAEFNLPYQQNIESKDNYAGQCLTGTNHEVYVDMLLYACLTSEAMEKLITSLRKYGLRGLYTYYIKSNFYLRLRANCPTDFTCKRVYRGWKGHSVKCEEATGTSIVAGNSNVPGKTTIVICNDDESCIKARQEAPTPPYSRYQYTVLDVRRFKPLGDPNTLDPDDITQYFLCSQGAAPIPYLKTLADKDVSCGCVCPPGTVKTTTANGVVNCEERKPTPGLCDTLPQQCYIYELTGSDATPTTCDVRGDTILSQPRVSVNIADNYVNYYNNLGGPLIGMALYRSEYDFDQHRAGSSVRVDNWSAAWTAFAANSEAYFKNINFRSPGLYTVKFLATDYFYADTCSLDVFVVDKSPPTSTATCPGTTNQQNARRQFSFDKTYRQAKADLGRYYKWLSSIQNDKCGSNIECDGNKPVYNTKYIGESSTALVPQSQITTCYDLKEDDLMNLLTESERLRVNPETYYKKGFCNKCCHLDKELDEKAVNYDCSLKKWTEACLTGPSCTYDGCISINYPSNFFVGSVEIASSYAQSTAKAVSYLKNKNYNSISEIHFINDCECLDDDVNCRKSVKIQELFDIKRRFKGELQKVLSSKGTPEKYISARYKLDSDEWKAYDLKNPADIPVYELTRLIHTVDIELRTPCGVLLSAKRFTIYQHPHHALKLCYALESSAFYQLSKTTGGTFINGDLCSYPTSDFAEFTFTFDHTKADLSSFNGYAGYRSFESIQCNLHHGGNTGAGQLPETKGVTIVDERSSIVLEHYALRLLRDPHTAKYTPVTVDCTVKYKGYDTYVHKEVCSRSFSAKDCDAPEISIFNQGDVASQSGTCGINCNRQKKLVPNSVCGGNIIDYVTENGVGKTVFHPRTAADDTCCTDCGPATCAAVFDDSIGIKKCALDGSTVVLAAASPALFMKNHGMLAFMSVGVAVSGVILSVGMLALRYYRTRQTGPTAEAYSPLI